jgi:hypothetical protein
MLGFGLMELQRNLNNCFAYDLVPSPSVVIAALRAARRVNDFPSAVRVFEGTLPLDPLHLPISTPIPYPTYIASPNQ